MIRRIFIWKVSFIGDFEGFKDEMVIKGEKLGLRQEWVEVSQTLPPKNTCTNSS